MIPRLRCDLQQRILHYDIWRNILSSDLRSQGFVPILEQDLAQIGLHLSDTMDFVWILDLGPEGISAEDLRLFHDFLCHQNGLPEKNFRAAFSCVQDVASLPYPAICIPDRLIINGNWYTHLQFQKVDWRSLEITHDIVCLMRRASLGRAHLAKRLLSKFSPEQLIITLGSDGNGCDPEIRQLVKPRSFPLILDSPKVDRVAQHRLAHDLFYRAAINLVVESSSQVDPNTWRSVFVTEKTFKALAWHQLPIWYAVPGMVDAVRRMGFDVFDDVFDSHRYDQTQDPWTRMTQVVSLLKCLCDSDIKKLRRTLWPRLEKNAALVNQKHADANSRHQQELHKLTYEI